MTAATRRPTTAPSGAAAATDRSDVGGLTLKAETMAQLDRQHWDGAIQVGEAAGRLRPDDLELAAMITVAIANGRSRGDARDATTDLQRRLEHPPTGADRVERASGWALLAAAQLARRDYHAADRAARRALVLDERNTSAWWAMAASYGGLGWFDECGHCLTTAGALGSPTELARWNVGRAINDWAMTKTPALTTTVVGVLLVGLLGVAVGITTPFFVREMRVARLDDGVRGLAAEAWRAERRMRIVAAAAVLAVVILWVVLLIVFGPS